MKKFHYIISLVIYYINILYSYDIKQTVIVVNVEKVFFSSLRDRILVAKLTTLNKFCNCS